MHCKSAWWWWWWWSKIMLGNCKPNVSLSTVCSSQKDWLLIVVSNSAFTLGHVRWRMCTMSLHMCPRMCPCFSMEPFTLRHVSTHSVTSLHVLNIDDAGHTQTLSAHMCPSAFTLGHMSLDKSPEMSSDLCRLSTITCVCSFVKLCACIYKVITRRFLESIVILWQH